MKNLNAKQIEQVKKINFFDTSKNFHGNRKKIGVLNIEDFKAIAGKKSIRRQGRFDSCVALSEMQIVMQLLRRSIENKGTNYFKILIEGSTGIYYAHPGFKHSDYNKSRIFDRNEKTIRIMNLFNSIVSK